MAGIGFELQRVLRKGGIGSFLQVALTGAMITAGPWLLSVGGIFLISRTSAGVLGGGQRLFLGMVSYSFAFGLILFGGSHYVFTRVVADLVYEEKRGAAGAALARFLAATGAAAAVVGGLGSLGLRPALGQGSLPLFRMAAAFLFVLVNLNWVLLIFASLLRRFMRLFVVYACGVALALGGVAVLAPSMGLVGAVLGFDAGQLFIVVCLAALSFHSYRPTREPGASLVQAFSRFRYLFLSGTVYYWGVWADKVVYWVTGGTQYPGTFVRTYQPYDLPVFFANLALIPGMVYFMVIAETQFFLRLKVFLKCMQSSIYREIQERKYRLLHSAQDGLREQCVLQGVFTAVLILGGRELALAVLGGVDALTLRLTFAAVFFHLSYLTLLIYLFYFQVYRRSFALAALYLGVNVACSVAIAVLGLWAYAPVPYLAAGAVATAAGVWLVDATGRSLDRLLFASYG